MSSSIKVSGWFGVFRNVIPAQAGTASAARGRLKKHGKTRRGRRGKKKLPDASGRARILANKAAGRVLVPRQKAV